ncbi:MAG: hypothetical protein MZV64_10480 [Ignavibacteriales bacterium]|nr:hypothetical protein [Ignavibacteriales bacterium]
MEGPLSRLSLVYDITGDGKNLIKFSASRYGSQSGFGMAEVHQSGGLDRDRRDRQDLR